MVTDCQGQVLQRTVSNCSTLHYSDLYKSTATAGVYELTLYVLPGVAVCFDRTVSGLVLPFDDAAPTVTVSALKPQFTSASTQLVDVGLNVKVKDGNCGKGDYELKMVVWADEGFAPTASNKEWRNTFAQVVGGQKRAA